MPPPATIARRWRTAAVSLLLPLLAACTAQGMQLEIDPAVAPACELPRVVTVRWSVPEHVTLPLELRINYPGRPLKRWQGVTTRAGEVATGPWAVDGLTFNLITTDGEILARRTLTATPCTKQASP